MKHLKRVLLGARRAGSDRLYLAHGRTPEVPHPASNFYVGNYYLKESGIRRAGALRERPADYEHGRHPRPGPAGRDAGDAAAESRVPADPPADPKAAVEQGATAAPTQLITKKGYDYEDPANRSWTSYLNPFSWGRRTTAEAVEAAAEASVAGEASSSVAGTAAAEETAPAEKKKSWFSFLNPAVKSRRRHPAAGGWEARRSSLVRQRRTRISPGWRSDITGVPTAPAADPALFSVKKPKPAAEKPETEAPFHATVGERMTVMGGFAAEKE